jgi:hypothetical protein
VPRGGEKDNPTAGVVGRTVNREIPGTGGKVIGMGGQWIRQPKHTVEFHGTLNPSSALGHLCIATCAWPPVHGHLCMAACAWPPVDGHLCGIQPSGLSYLWPLHSAGVATGPR